MTDGASRAILVVEDDRVTRMSLRRLLMKHGFEVTCAENGAEAKKLIEAADFSLVLTDWSMPIMDGASLCRWIRSRRTPAYTYLLMLTAASDPEEITRGFEAGADDYVTKPFVAGELLARLRVGDRILRLHEHMLQTEARLRAIADRDGLTSLLNRRALDARLSEAFSYARRHRRPLSIAILDLDHFKDVNDKFGHSAGDAVLRVTAERVSEAVRAYDELGRYGGEEFMLILPDTPAWSARLVAERVRQVLSQTPVVEQARIIPISGSIGVATAVPEFDGTLEQMALAADDALYEAKRRGRNRVISTLLGARGVVENPSPTLDLVGN